MSNYGAILSTSRHDINHTARAKSEPDDEYPPDPGVVLHLLEVEHLSHDALGRILSATSAVTVVVEPANEAWIVARDAVRLLRRDGAA